MTILPQRRVIDEPINLRYFTVAVGVAMVHLATAIDILLGGSSILSTTPLWLMSVIVGNRNIIAAILIVTALLAVLPFLLPRSPWQAFMALVAPQQALLLCHFVSVTIAVLNGHYPDGYVPNGGTYFIFADQAWLIMIIVLHTLEYVETL